MTAKKKIFLGLFVALVCLIGYLVYFFYLAPSANLQSIYLIPKDAVFVIETQKPVDNWDKIRESEAWNHLQKNDYFFELTESIHKMDTIFHNKKKLFELFGTRSLFFSVHMYKPKEYALFYVIDLKRIAKLKLLRTYLNTILDDSYSLSRREYHGSEIIELYDSENRETLHIAFIKNQLIASYVHSLVEASIDQVGEPYIGRNLDFIEIKKKTGNHDMFRLYLQHDYLDEYANYFTDQPTPLIHTLSEHFLFSGVSFELKSNNTMVADGYTAIRTSYDSYFKALQKSGTSKRSIPAVAPKRTAVYLSFGFDSFKELYSNFLIIQQENSNAFEAYKTQLQDIEGLLKIDIKENFVSWIGDEIAVLQIQSSIAKGKNDMALVIKTNDIESALHNLSFVQKQLKKKTPLKFKSITYKEYVINFMAIKGFFKLFFGNLFESFDKPYFTVIDDYVVFSDKPNTLKSIIDDYIAKETLSTSEDFQHFSSYFKKKSSVFAYINTPVLYENMLQLADKGTKEQIKEHRDFIICFPQVGFQLIPTNELFKIKLVVDYQDAEIVKSKSQFKDLNIYGPSVKTNKVTDDHFLVVKNVFDVALIYPNDLNADRHVKRYKNGSKQIEVALKDGLKHGRYLEYFEKGEIKIKGRYRKGKQVGQWRLYDKQGNVLKKKRF